MTQYKTRGGDVWAAAPKILSSPHFLVAGTTGAGKSVVINNLIHALLCSKTPNDAQFVLIDPKYVELRQYSKLPFCAGYACETAEAAGLLDNSIDLLYSRLQYMTAANSKTWTGQDYYIIIDELADLLISEGGGDIRIKLQKILQLGRAGGVHVIGATQAPCRKILPAELVLNFTDRLALHCLASIESRQIINAPGAERLPLHGQGLYLSGGVIRRIPIPLIPQTEINSAIDFWSNKGGHF